MNKAVYEALFGDKTFEEVSNEIHRRMVKRQLRKGYPQNRPKKDYDSLKNIFLRELMSSIYNMEDDSNSKVKMTIHITKEDNTEETYSFTKEKFEKVKD